MTKLWLLRLLAPVIGRLPTFSYRVAWLVGWLSWELRPRARRTVIRNLLPLVDGDRARARRESLAVFRNVARYYVDLCSTPFRDMPAYEPAHLSIEGAERLALLMQRKPVIIVSAHTGNPELALQALTQRGQSFVALVEPLRPPAVARKVQELRGAAGGEFVDADFNGLRTALKHLHDGGIVGIVADRDIQRNGVCTRFMGREVLLGRGPWELARRTGAAVLPVFARRLSYADQSITVCEPYYVDRSDDHEEDIRRAAERFASVLEPHLRAHPGEWTVLEDFWRVHRCG